VTIIEFEGDDCIRGRDRETLKAFRHGRELDNEAHGDPISVSFVSWSVLRSSRYVAAHDDRSDENDIDEQTPNRLRAISRDVTRHMNNVNCSALALLSQKIE
jgi:hypothetical protein